MAAVLYVRAFRRLCLAGLAVGMRYTLVVLGIEGARVYTGDVVEVAAAHPVFFLGLAFGKFMQGLLAFGVVKRRSREDL